MCLFVATPADSGRSSAVPGDRDRYSGMIVITGSILIVIS
jgi:hypothetical protein